MTRKLDIKIIKKYRSIAISIFILPIFINLVSLSEEKPVFGGKEAALNVVVSHEGKGGAEICLKNEGFNNLCDNYDLTQQPNPLLIPVGIEDPETGDNFEVCYEFKDTNNEECIDFTLSGQDPQIIELSIVNTNVVPSINNNGQGGIINKQPETPATLPPLPPMS